MWAILFLDAGDTIVALLFVFIVRSLETITGKIGRIALVKVSRSLTVLVEVPWMGVLGRV